MSVRERGVEPFIYCRRSVSVTGRVVLRADDQTTPFLRPAVDCLQDIYKFLLILKDPVDLVVITRPKIAHPGMDISLGHKSGNY